MHISAAARALAAADMICPNVIDSCVSACGRRYDVPVCAHMDVSPLCPPRAQELFDARCHTNVNVGQLIVATMSLVRKHRLTLASEFASVIISMGLLEGMARSLDPAIDPVRKLRPFLLREAVSVAKVLIADQAQMLL